MQSNEGADPALADSAEDSVFSARAVHARWRLVALITLAALIGGLAVVIPREPQYSATAKLAITALPQYEGTFLGTSLIRDSGNTSATGGTTAAVLETQKIAGKAAKRLGHGWTAASVLEAVSIEPVPQSTVLDVNAVASDPDTAARVANTFVDAALSERRETLDRELDQRLALLNARLRKLAGDDYGERGELSGRIRNTELVRKSGNDPTLARAEVAIPPASESGASPFLLLFGAVVGGMMVGIAAALLTQRFSRRLGDEEAFSDIYPLPVLARVPRLPRRLGRKPEASLADLPQGARTAFRALAVQLERSEPSERTIAVTSAAPGDGRTTVAVGLGLALADAGHAVIVLDFDSSAEHASDGSGPVTAASDGAVDPPEAGELHVFFAPTMPDDVKGIEPLLVTIEEAQAIADYVVIETPPVTTDSDAVRLARAAGQIVLVGRRGRTRRNAFKELRGIFGRTGLRPVGLVLIRRGQLHYSQASTYEPTAARPVRARSRRARPVAARGSATKRTKRQAASTEAVSSAGQ